MAFPLEFRLKEVNFIYMYRHTSVENDLFPRASRRTAQRAAVCCTACQQWWCIVALVPIPVIICAMCWASRIGCCSTTTSLNWSTSNTFKPVSALLAKRVAAAITPDTFCFIKKCINKFFLKKNDYFFYFIIIIHFFCEKQKKRIIHCPPKYIIPPIFCYFW